MLVEVQALVSTSTYGNARRMASGIDQKRLSLLLAVLEKRAGLNLVGDDVFVNVAGGMTVDEPAADLGVVAAVASSLRNRPVRADDGGVRRGRPGRRGPRRSPRRRCASARPRRWGSRAASCRAATSTRATAGRPVGCELVGVRTVGEALDALIAVIATRAALDGPLASCRCAFGSYARTRSPPWPGSSRPRAVRRGGGVRGAAAVSRSGATWPGQRRRSASCSAALVVVFESRLRDAPVTAHARRAARRRHRSRRSPRRSARRSSGPTPATAASRSCTASSLLVLPVPRARDRRRARASGSSRRG